MSFPDIWEARARDYTNHAIFRKCLAPSGLRAAGLDCVFGSASLIAMRRGLEFSATHWSMIRLAGSAGPGSAAAMERLAEVYWFPVYGFTRRWRSNPDDARELTQEFFARFFEKRWVERADAAKGKFRAWLLTLLKRFLRDEHDRETAEKRGGGDVSLSIAWEHAEERFAAQERGAESAEYLYERQWAEAVMRRGLDRLSGEMRATGRELQCEMLAPFLSQEASAQAVEDVAQALGLSLATLRVAIHRLRRRYRDSVREVLREELFLGESLEDELRELVRILAR